MDEDAGRLRLRIFAFVALVLFGALFTRLWYLQGIESEVFQAEAEALVLRESYEQAPRGRILDRSGRVLVDNRVVDVVTVDKSVIDDLDSTTREEMFHRLAIAISRSGRLTKLETIIDELESIQYGRFDIVPVAVDVSPQLMVFLGERPEQFPGVEVVSRTVRSYPYRSLAAHVLGYVGPVTQAELETANARLEGEVEVEHPRRYQLADEIGKTGVERTFEDVLRGEPGVRYFEVDNRGRVIRERTELGRDPVPGNDLVLTIDIGLQALAEQQIVERLAAVRSPSPTPGEDNVTAPAGSVVATDPRTGELLAMASFPTYDPSQFVNGISFAEFEMLTAPENFSPILNRAIQENYAAGSTFKLITAFAALEAGLLGPESRIQEARNGTIEDTGIYTLPQCRVEFEASDTCEFSSPRGRAGLGAATYPLPLAITESSDVFFYKLAAEGFFPAPAGPDGDEAIQTMARRFGFGTRTAIQLPYERAGVVPDRAFFDAQAEAGVFERDGSQWFAGDTVLLSIGQGELFVTPVQLVNAYATMANGGTLHQINVARQVRSPSGEVIREFAPRELRDIELDPGHRAQIERGLLGVPTGTGTAASAFSGFPLGAWPVAGKTGTAQVTNKADTSLFVGYGPVDTRVPEIAVVAILEEAGFGGLAAAPIVRTMLEAYATDTIPEVLSSDETARVSGESTTDADADPENSDDVSTSGGAAP